MEPIENCVKCNAYFGHRGGYGDKSDLCGGCWCALRPKRRQALWDASPHRDIDLTGQVLSQRVTPVDEWEDADNNAGIPHERIVVLETRFNWYESNNRVLVAHFRRGSGVAVMYLGVRKYKGALTLSHHAQKQLHQAMIAWYADTQEPSGICIDCGAKVGDVLVRCSHCKLEQDHPLPEPEVVQTDEEIAARDRDEIPW